MFPVQCSYCGLPFRVRRVEAGSPLYCCSGCALASRLPPVGPQGQYPVTPALVAALVVAFAFFNQVLFWTLAVLLAREGRADTARIFAGVSTGLGVLVGLALAVGIWRAPVRRWTDAAVALAALLVMATAWQREWPAGRAVGADAALVFWLARGWGKQKFRRKPVLPV